jgi:exopolysaccharide production protein ExoZ
LCVSQGSASALANDCAAGALTLNHVNRHAGLDLLRALAIVLTFFVHFVWVVGGWLYQRNFEMLAIADAKSVPDAILIWLCHSQHGVFLFFVLSGYLMGRKWFSARDVPTLAFLRDRAWRTLPGAFLAVLATLLLLASSGKLPADPIAHFFENAFFLNWFRKDDSRALLIVTWSLHAEWLFYLSLPLVAWCVKKVAHDSPALGVFLIVAAICVALKFLSLRGAAYAWFFAVGVIAAIKQNDWRAAVSRTPWFVVLLGYVSVNLIYAWLSPTAAALQKALWNPFDTHAIFFGLSAGLLLLKTADTDFGNALWVRIGAYIGKISYSIYLWHLLVILAVGQWFKWPVSLESLGVPTAIFIYTSATIALTWVVSAISFRFIEQPYFDRKR